MLLATASVPYTLTFSTKPPSFQIRSFSIGFNGLWSSLTTKAFSSTQQMILLSPTLPTHKSSHLLRSKQTHAVDPHICSFCAGIFLRSLSHVRKTFYYSIFIFLSFIILTLTNVFFQCFPNPDDTLDPL